MLAAVGKLARRTAAGARPLGLQAVDGVRLLTPAFPMSCQAVRAISALTNPPPTGYVPFRLPASFVDSYASRKPDFGFNGLGTLVEQWLETVERVVNGTFNTQKQHVGSMALGWDETEAQSTAQDIESAVPAGTFSAS
ncbi:hypothetical protein T492DRAFT_906118 [Pavlovales sp. CCMP2436]|nr:hypothetical protein T492DRAFT_906118 [Pavlovales sp. CCMP2436]